MCGFVGAHDIRPDSPALRRLDHALAAIRHRGPDGTGTWVGVPFGLAHARLSIIDLSDAARQPMTDSTGRFTLVFNGEIYNYRDLAERYFPDDRSLRRDSDTAVLLAMYRRFGADCLPYLDGMFAFAVIDSERRAVFMARDRFGEKPLYWVQTDGCMAFASEIGALRQLIPEHDWSIDREGLLLFHSTGSIPAPYTIYRGVRSVKAGCWMSFDTDGHRVEATYWALGDGPPPAVDHEAVIDSVRERLLHAARTRLVSDVPVGIFLSGGLDSGSILSLTRSLGGPVPDTLCIDFADPRFSEYALARSSADRFGSRLHRCLVTPEEFGANLDSYFAAADQPTTDGFNTYFAGLYAKQTGIKVWLSGVGGDELFGGYPSFAKIGGYTLLSRLLQGMLKDSWIRVAERRLHGRYRLARILHLGLRGPATRRAYQSLRNTVPADMANDMLAHAMRTSSDSVTDLLDHIYPETDCCHDDYQRATVLESAVYMRYQLLRDIDNFSMAHSLEFRAPFLDHRLFEYVYGLSSNHKKNSGRIKPLLIDALPRRLPDAVVAQPKRGFTFPIETWLRKELRQSWEGAVLRAENRAIWDLDSVARLWRLHLAGQLHWSVPWQFYTFARWCEAHHG
jgi:asparagine synthase (glutamine-hydrolysing)